MEPPYSDASQHYTLHSLFMWLALEQNYMTFLLHHPLQMNHTLCAALAFIIIKPVSYKRFERNKIVIYCSVANFQSDSTPTAAKSVKILLTLQIVIDNRGKYIVHYDLVLNLVSYGVLTCT